MTINLCRKFISRRARTSQLSCRSRWFMCIVIFSVVIVVYVKLSIPEVHSGGISDRLLNLLYPSELIKEKPNGKQYFNEPTTKKSVNQPRQIKRQLKKVKEKEIKGWEIDVDRDPKKYVDPAKDTTIISGREICNETDTPFVAIIYTTPSNFLKRMEIRQKWNKIRGVKMGFLVGLATSPSIQFHLEREEAQFKDIIQENFVDSYHNLTIKSIALLKWFLRSCPKSNFLVKTDEDAYHNVGIFYERLAFYPPMGILVGMVTVNRSPYRQDWHKWYVPWYMYPYDKYPVYLQGGDGYAMSKDVVAKLYNASLDTPIMNMEDVYITGLCARKAGLVPFGLCW